MMTIDFAEYVRDSKDLTVEEFSMKLGYSPRAYYQALKRKKISRWMAKEIRERFHIREPGK
jgi:hypothetical protein